jgi:hypothetical protein
MQCVHNVLGMSTPLVLRTAITPPVWRGAPWLPRLVCCTWNLLRINCVRYLVLHPLAREPPRDRRSRLACLHCAALGELAA